MVDGDLYILSRGRVRGAGGVTAEIEDRAGTLFKVDPNLVEPVTEPEVSAEIRQNGEVFALPTDPPFKLWNRNSVPPESDRKTDRPYACLRWHEATKSFYICAFSGVDKSRTGPGRSFSKNLTDAILRYDTRTEKWYEVERHDVEAGGIYPHHDPSYNDPPHGWINGANNLLSVGNWLYVVGKDNNLMVRYDLRPYLTDPEAGHAPSEWMLDSNVYTGNAGEVDFRGHSALGWDNGWLYIASRTSSHIIRMKMDESGEPARPYEMELVAKFDPYNRETGKSANLTDMDFDDQGRLYIVSAKPSRVYRFTPDPSNIFDARNSQEEAWRDFSVLTNNPNMKSENLFVTGNKVFVTSGDGYGYQAGASGTVYRTEIAD